MNIKAVQDQDGCGEITYCRISGNLDINLLSKAWSAHGLDTDLLPSIPTTDTALKAAMREVKLGNRMLLRPLAGRSGFALVQETAKESSLDYATDSMLRCSVTEEDGVVSVACTPESHPLADAVKTHFNETVNKLQAAQISSWLWSRLAHECDAISLRDTGGIYFIPKNNVDLWHKFKTVVQSISDIKIFSIPAVEAADAVDAVLDALLQEVNRQVSTLGEDLTKAGKRALSTRKARAMQLKRKVERYEKLFSKALPIMTDQIDALASDIVTCSLAASGDD